MHAALAALAAVILLPAHAAMIGSTPSDGDTVTEQPGTFSVVMNEEILSLEGADSANRLQLTDAQGLFYGDGCVVVEGDTISLEAELGEAGDYSLAYQVVSADGHPVDGTVSFAFEPAEGEAGAAGSETAPICGAAPAASEPASTSTTEPEASVDPDEAAPGPVATDDATPSDAVEGDEGGDFPFIAVGVLALLVVLAVIAWTVNRGSRRRRDEA
ncbi:copper resistance CopC family protein [Agrococcus lahaulensis]|uniref:copper resistance CopC family protein n=1 Tax=Agrococcus lahaulensis TaxID=341722 RepID=UPI0006871B27|nr:copper resistance CopC family protein [Agrococcus lahaulensis]